MGEVCPPTRGTTGELRHEQPQIHTHQILMGSLAPRRSTRLLTDWAGFTTHYVRPLAPLGSCASTDFVHRVDCVRFGRDSLGAHEFLGGRLTGRTADSEPANPGSNPGLPTNHAASRGLVFDNSTGREGSKLAASLSPETSGGEPPVSPPLSLSSTTVAVHRPVTPRDPGSNPGEGATLCLHSSMVEQRSRKAQAGVRFPMGAPCRVLLLARMLGFHPGEGGSKPPRGTTRIGS